MIPADEDKRKAYRESGWWGDVRLGQMFQRNAARHPDRLALADPPNRADFAFGDPLRLTYRELAAEVDRIAGALAAQGVGKDDVLIVQLPNISELTALYFACAEIGAVISPIAVQYREHELRSLLSFVAPKAFVCATMMKGADHLAAARAVLPRETKLMTFGPNAPDDVIDLSTAVTDPERLNRMRNSLDVNADDIFTICWTSGTTGAPKGVPRSHNHWAAIGPVTHSAAQLRDGDVILNPFPMINMASIGGVIMSWLQSAGTLALHHPFDLPVFLRQINEEKPAFTLAPPAILNMILNDERLAASIDFSNVRAIGSGSAPLAPAMVKGFQDRYGIAIVNLFGSNEGMSLASGSDDVPDPEHRAAFFPAAASYPSLYGAKGGHLSLRLVDAETGDEVTDMALVGELEISGPTVFEGYFNAPDETAAAFRPDGYFRTGDLFEYAEDGRFLKFVGRSKDLIMRGGVNIAPEEIDQLLGGHPKLAEACAFSIPDDVMGERIGLAVVPKPEEEVSLDDITGYLKELGVAVFKLPEKLFKIGPLPRNALNKVLRHEVRARALETRNGDAADG